MAQLKHSGIEHSKQIVYELETAMSKAVYSRRWPRLSDRAGRLVGPKMKEIRERQGITLKQMEEKTGIPSDDLVKIERLGTPRNSTIAFRKIIAELGVNEEDSRKLVARYYLIPNDVGLTLRIAREDANLTRSDVSMSIGVSEGRIGRIELGTLRSLPLSPIAADIRPLVEALRVNSEDVTMLLEAIR